MRVTSKVLVVVSIVVAGACGKNSAHPVDSQGADVAIDSPPPPPGCDYGELKDATNDSISDGASGSPEQTFLEFSNTMVLCGTIDNSHYDASSGTIDADVYDISVGSDSELRVDLTGAGAEAFDDVEVIVLDSMGNTYGDGLFLTNHAVADVPLGAGTYEIVMYAGSASAPTSNAPVPYKIKLINYDILSACTQVSVANHTEGATDNDVMAVSFTNGFRQLTTKTTDAVEASGITLAAGTNAAIGATIAAGTTSIDADDYYDRDTFEFTTGANVNELTLRVDWPDMTDDLDFYMMPRIDTPPTGDVPEITNGTFDTGVGAGGTGGPEINITAVEPNTPYWIWVGGYTGSTTLPENYTISLCPANFTP